MFPFTAAACKGVGKTPTEQLFAKKLKSLYLIFIVTYFTQGSCYQIAIAIDHNPVWEQIVSLFISFQFVTTTLTSGWADASIFIKSYQGLDNYQTEYTNSYNSPPLPPPEKKKPNVKYVFSVSLTLRQSLDQSI